MNRTPATEQKDLQSASVKQEVSPNVYSSVMPSPVLGNSLVAPTSSVRDSTDNNQFTEKETSSGHSTMTVERQTVQLPKPPSPVTASQHVTNHIDSSTNSVEDRFPIEDCVIVKAGGPLGLSIVGGSDFSSSPFGLETDSGPGIFVSKVSTYKFHAEAVVTTVGLLSVGNFGI